MYVINDQNADFDDLPIEYEKKLFAKRQIDCLTGNILERLKVSLIKRSFDNRIYKTNPRNDDFDYLTFDGDERLITIQQIYCINYDIVFRLNSGLSVYV